MNVSKDARYQNSDVCFDSDFIAKKNAFFQTGSLPVIMWFLFGEVSSSSGCLGLATLFYFGTP